MRRDYMNKIRFFSLFTVTAASLLLGGCGTMPEVTTYRNPVTGIRTDVLAENLLDTGEEAPREMLWLNAYRHFRNDWEFNYYLEAIYGAREEAGYLDIPPGRTLTIIADGEELTFTGLGSFEKEAENGAVFESARYEANASVMRKIADAERVTVRLRGENGIIVRDFRPENKEKFQKFVEQAGGVI